MTITDQIERVTATSSGFQSMSHHLKIFDLERPKEHSRRSFTFSVASISCGVFLLISVITFLILKSDKTEKVVTPDGYYSEHDPFFHQFDEKFGYEPSIINHAQYDDIYGVIDTDYEYYNGYNYNALFEILF